MAGADFWLTTDRLALRRFTPADFDWLFALYRDPDVMRHMGGPKDRAYVEEVLNVRILEYYATRPGLGIWLTTERSTGQAAGFHLLNEIRGETIVQVGFFLAKAAWGKGYATEMATALLRYGFVELGLPRIVGMTGLDNRGSQSVLTKIGLRRNGERAFAHPAYADAGLLAWFERDAGEWLGDHV